MSFPTFKDLDKSAADIFNEDFDYKYTLKVKSSGPWNTTLTTNTQYDPKDNKLIPKLSLKWAHPSGFTLEKLEASQDLKFNLETSLTGAAPGLKLEFKGNDSDKADLSFTYKVSQATVTGDFDISNLASAKASFVTGTGDISGGANVDLKIAKSTIEKSTFGVGLAWTPCKGAFVGLRANNNFQNFSGLTSYQLNDPFCGKPMTLAGQVNYSAKETNATVASVFNCCPETSWKFKVNSNGVVSSSLKQNFEKKFSVIGTAEVPLQLNTVKFGVNATLG
jgi:hypothetical protein